MLTELNKWRIKKWLEMREISNEKYDNLPNEDKAVLQGMIGLPTRCTTENERRRLYRRLVTISVGRTAMDPTDFVPSAVISKFFSLSSEESLADLEKY